MHFYKVTCTLHFFLQFGQILINRATHLYSTFPSALCLCTSKPSKHHFRIMQRAAAFIQSSFHIYIRNFNHAKAYLSGSSIIASKTASSPYTKSPNIQHNRSKYKVYNIQHITNTTYIFPYPSTKANANTVTNLKI